MNYSIPSNCTVENRHLDSFILEYNSCETLNEEQWVSCQFSIHPEQEHLMALGSESGSITLADCRYPLDPKKFVLKWLKADNAVVLGFCFIPKQEEALIELSGSGSVRVWDLVKDENICLFGHDNDCIVTGSKDGDIRAWDIRDPPKVEKFKGFNINKRNTNVYTSIRHFKCAHRIPLQSIDKVRRASVSKDMPTVTGILHIDQSLFISSSSSASSGLRIWDLRYQKMSSPLQTLTVPQQSKKESGITSLCWDRFHSNFFATCTDNCIYEYNISTSTAADKKLPVRHLKSHSISTFFVQCAASPVSDHLLSGTSENHALIWDLQENRRYRQDSCFNRSVLPCPSKGYLPRPKFQLNGHFYPVDIATWSSKANYISTLDEVALRIWSKRSERTRPDGELPNEMIVGHRPVQLLYPELLDLP